MRRAQVCLVFTAQGYCGASEDQTQNGDTELYPKADDIFLLQMGITDKNGRRPTIRPSP